MTRLEEKTNHFIVEHTLFTSDNKMLATVSGGVDSVVLCHLLKSLSYSFSIAHCNFGLRGQESDNDQLFVEQLAKELNVTYYTKKFSTESHAHSEKVSTQMAARELRYDWFNQLATQHQMDYILTAHHANDLVETALFNLSKGTGLSGLRGIQKKTGNIVRPLSFAAKDDILAYAKEKGLSWREDPSNQSNKYHRNRIRNNVIPDLKRINPALEQTYLSTQNRLEHLESFVQYSSLQIQREFLCTSGGQTTLGLEWFDLQKGSLILLEDILKPYGLNWNQCIDLGKAITTRATGKFFKSNEHTILLDRNKLMIDHTLAKDQVDLLINEQQKTVQILDYTYQFQIVNTPIEIIQTVNYAFLDADKVRFPIQARNWKQGDRFVPLGMSSPKKVSDFMIDTKIPLNLKKRLIIFESDHDIIWIAGKRIDDRFKISDQTTRALIIKQEINV